MLAIQQFLRRYNNPEEALSALTSQYAVKYNIEEDLVIFNYDMINSGHSQVENECRALILQYNSWDVVNRSFTRFLNYGEGHAAKIDWNSAYALTKLDGSLVSFWNYNGRWRCSTRKRINADGELGVYGTFSEHIWKLIPDGSVFTNPDYCYSFEFTSFKNRIVTPYDKDELTLLAVFDKKNNVELSWEDASAACPYFARPKRYSCSSINDIKKLIETLGDTEEGFVVLDSHNNRIKCKNPAYLALHHAYSRGGMMGVDRLFELALGVDRQEVISYFPDLVPKLTEVDLFIEEFVKEAEDLWQNNCEQGIWKFANAVKDSRTSSFLFYRFNKDRNADIHKWIREPKNQKILVKDFKRGS